MSKDLAFELSEKEANENNQNSNMKKETKDILWDTHETKSEDLKPLEFSNELSPNLFGIEETKAHEMTSGLKTVFAEREILKSAYIDVIELPITTENLPTFKELRLKIVKNRTQGIEKWHTTNKAFYLAGGRFVDAIKNKEILENHQMEEKLLEAEKFFENQEKERVAKLQLERISLVEPYLESVVGLDLTTMDDYVFDAFLEGSKSKFEAKLQAEKEAEEKRISEAKAEAERMEAQRLENEKLKAELKAKKDAEIKAENERIAKELADKKEADKLAKAPIKKQLDIWVETFELPNLITENETSKEIVAKFEAFKKWAKSEIEKL